MAAKLLAEELTIDETQDGKKVTEKYRISFAELTGASDQAKLDSALAIAGVPALGGASVLGGGVVCVSRTVSNVSGTVVDVVCQFEIPSDDSDNALLDTTGVVRFRSGLVADQTYLDAAGDYMFITYNGTVNDFWPDEFFAGAGLFINNQQLVQAEVMRPQWGFDISKRVTFALALSHAKAYIGRVNETTWSALDPRTVLCTDVEVDVITSQEIRVKYGFEYRPETWDFTAVFKAWGRPPENIDTPPGNGTGTFVVYPVADFNNLGVNL